MSQFCAAFGQPQGVVIDYQTYVRLVLNLDRVGFRRAVDTARGFYAANTTNPLSRAWADAIADDESEVDEILFKINSARHLMRVKSKLGFQ